MLTDIAIIVMAALLGNFIFNKMGLPGILGISQETLHRIGGPAIRMGFVPTLVGGAAAHPQSTF